MMAAPGSPDFAVQLGIEMLFVPGGAFLMGTEEPADTGEATSDAAVWGSFLIGRAPASEGGRSAASCGRASSAALRAREYPQHEVELDPYCISRHPITIAQYSTFASASGRRVWQPVMPEPCARDVAQLPASFVSWEDAAAFCRWLSQRTNAAFRIPAEAEWEMSARGTDGRDYPWGDQPPTSWRSNYAREVGTVTDVRSYPAGASPWGCLDMAGNVWEWCSDWFGPDYYARSPLRNPTGPERGMSRVIRGGAYDSEASALRSSARFYDNPAGATFFPCGFRIAMSV